MKLPACRIAAVITAAAFLLSACCLYRGDFVSLATPEQQTEAIRRYCSADETVVSLQAVLHPAVVHDRTIGSTRVLVFTDREIPRLLGSVQFRRGIFGGWQPIRASYAAGPVMGTETLKNQEGIRIVYAADCPPEVASYRVQANPDQPDTLMVEGTVDGPAFFHVYETDRNYFPSLHLYGADGTELDRRDYLAADPDVPSPGIGSAETNLVYWVCGGWLVIGWLIVRYLWDGGRSRPVTNPAAGD
ncbi:hypothetical protein [Dysosmobacter sp.]|uniref:hypothetical protein n=1 Tax=Dysosmobacter sp. TaxID=2591382 RepID=UPI002A8838E7|nr:hypothetical protein [Dysosmobacter sp.]MDY3282151.1 hypothetical protein [Dysosmobacter sp.]